MSLQVWLPLNGDLTQQGASGITVVNNGATVNANGKIGNCYAFNGSTSYIALSGDDLFKIFTGGTQQFSITMWVFHADTTRAILFGDYATTGGIGFNIELSTAHAFRFYWNGSPDTYPSNATIGASTWAHIALTYDGTKLQSYINGIAKGSWSGTLGTKNKTSGEFRLGRDNRSDSTAFNGRMNDFRIYDHCLSAAEVKEISQGLVLHYKLDGGIFGNSNLVLGSNTAATSTNTWLGHSATGGNTSTIVYDGDTPCIKITRDNVAQSSWDYLSYDRLIHSQIKTNTTYTITFDCKPDVDGSISFTGFVNGNATNYLTISTTNVQNNCYANKWNHMVYKCTTKSSFDGITIGGQVVYFSRSTSLRAVNINVLFKNIKVEEGDAETPWCPADSELDIDRTIIKDNSGYNYNGTSFGSLISTTETGRYTSSTKLNSSSPTDNTETGITYILSPLALTTPNQMTVAWWAKPESGYGSSTNHAAFCTSVNSRPTDYNTTAMHHRDTGFDLCPNSGSAIRLTFNQYTANQWHHYAITYDGQKATAYKDGVALTNTSMAAASQLKSFNNIWIGYSQAGGVRRKTLGSYSDFRVYVTALSAEDILSLYHTSAKVDNKQNLHTFELVENNSAIKINKHGQTLCNELEENTATKFFKTNQIIETNEIIEL